ncbi:cysteine hydrolase family protein [Pseudochelatococcus sp. B33]
MTKSVDDLADWLMPDRAALLVIDMQVDYVAADGHLARRGQDVSVIEQIVPTIAHLIASARSAQVPVIYFRQTAYADGRISSAARARYKKRAKPGLGNVYPLIGTRGYDIIPALKPDPNDTVIDKVRSSAFRLTPLDLLLRCTWRTTVVICGAVTEGCVHATVQDAANYDYLPIVIGDGVGSNRPELHRAAMTIMEYRHDICTSSYVIGIWNKHAVK